MRISVIGLGKLGAPLAAVLADKGFEVIGVDLNADTVAALEAGRAPMSEPGLQECIDRAHARLHATTDIADAVSRSDVSFVIVPTPSGADGAFSNAHVIAAVRKIGAALRTKGSYHLVAITSTVMPGSTGGSIREALEVSAGQQLGESIGLCYSPEFIALGSVIRDMLNPDFILIGELDARSGDTLEHIYRATCDNKPPIQRMSFVNAELTKIAVNTFVTTKISFANMLSDICDRLPGADAMVVTAALGRDSRIGRKYLTPALGYGGPCFPRDTTALASMAHQLGARAELVTATEITNEQQLARVTGLVRRLQPHGTIGILGLSYKPDTPVIEESQGLGIAMLLAEAGYRVLVHDPQALDAAMAVLRDSVEAVDRAEACAAAADLLIVATAWPSFKHLPHEVLRRANRRLPVIDCWHLLPPAEFSEVAELIYLGRGGEAPVPAIGDAEMPTRLVSA
jgi:UDPglucose 6-dehydrogenase